jgi:hypothetical protein
VLLSLRWQRSPSFNGREPNPAQRVCKPIIAFTEAHYAPMEPPHGLDHLDHYIFDPHTTCASSHSCCQLPVDTRPVILLIAALIAATWRARQTTSNRLGPGNCIL